MDASIVQHREVKGRCLLSVLQDSLQVIPGAFVDQSVKGSKFLDKFQFERIGFFSVDKDSTPDKVSPHTVSQCS